MSSTPAGTRIVGTMHRTPDGRGAVRMEDLYDTGINDLWSALTDPPRLARWIGEVHGDLRLGGQIHARFTSSWEGEGRIDICQAPHHLAVSTSDETVIEATLTAEQGKTRLVIEERGLPLDNLEAYGAGWQAHVEDLAAHIDGRPAADWRTRWTELIPAYQDLGRDPA